MSDQIAMRNVCLTAEYSEKHVKAKIPNYNNSISFFGFVMSAKVKPKGLLHFRANISYHDNYPFLRLFINVGDEYNAIAFSVERDPERAIQHRVKHGFGIDGIPHVSPPTENLCFSACMWFFWVLPEFRFSGKNFQSFHN